MSEIPQVCFDKILPSEMNRPASGSIVQIGIGTARAAFQLGKLWPNGSVIKIKFMGGSTAQRDMVKKYAVEWTEHANLKFEFVTSGTTQVRISFEDLGAWSYVGTDSLNIPSNEATMNFGWLDQGVILHEFGHMIGMIHEHQNPRSNPIKWNRDQVIKDLSGPPNNWDMDTIEFNLFEKYEVSQINGSDFDPKSVMLYSFPKSWTTDGFQTQPNEVLSSVDKAFARAVYPSSSVKIVDLPIIEYHKAEISKPGQEDLYSFEVKTSARYTIETDGRTNLVMNLYGPGGNLVAKDDDSGLYKNPRIVAELLPGKYMIQIRHYSETGKGAYAIKVLKN